MLSLPSDVGVPLVVCVVAVLNGGRGVCCGVPVLCCPTLVLSCSPFVLSHPSACLLSQHCWFGCVCVLLVTVFLVLLPFVGGVRGSARAALRARTLSPNTIVSLVAFYSVLFLSPAFLLLSAFLLCWNGGGVCLPCVGALCWHDGDW